MRPHRAIRQSSRCQRLSVVLLTLVLVVWGINARVAQYQKPAPSRTAPIALFEPDEQKSKSVCEAHRFSPDKGVSDVANLSSLSFASLLVASRASRRPKPNGAVRSLLAFHSSNTFFRPPPGRI